MEPTAKILVIDDEPGMREMLSYELEQQGYKVITAKNGKEGKEKFTKDDFDLVITDMKMPGMDGIQVLKEIKTFLDPNVEVIIMTGYGTMESAIESFRQNAYDYINKPFSIDEISHVIRKALERRNYRLTISLYEMSKTIFSKIKSEEVLEIVIDTTRKALNSDAISLMLLNEKGELYIAASHGFTDKNQKKVALEIGERIIKDKTSETISGDLANDPRFKDIKKFGDIKFSIFIPLLINDKLISILNINRINIIGEFTKADVDRANIFGSLVAMAIDNSSIFEKLKIPKN